MTKELSFLIDIVKKAEEISKEAFKVETKYGENDLVTNLDVKIEEFLIGEIKKAYPTFDIVSEEENYNKVPTDNCFIIDPIDGTINFANGLTLWATQIACRKDGKTVASIINMPRVNEMYYADKSGAYLNGEKIKVNVVPIKNALYAVDGNNNLPAYLRMRQYSSNRRNFGGVCISMAYTAAGRIHGACFRSDKPWDYEPGLFLVKMAGGETMSIPGFHAGAMNKEFLDILKLETSKKIDKPNVFVLHSLNGDTMSTWGKDVKSYLTEKEVDCFLPDFPIRAESNYKKFDEILSSYLNTNLLNEKSIVVCHCISNAYFLRFCKEHNFKPKHYIAVAPSFVYDYPVLRTDYLKNVAKSACLKPEHIAFGKKINTTCIYSYENQTMVKDDKQERFTRFIKDLSAKGMFLEGYEHFDSYHRIYKIPELITLLDNII